MDETVQFDDKVIQSFAAILSSCGGLEARVASNILVSVYSCVVQLLSSVRREAGVSEDLLQSAKGKGEGGEGRGGGSPLLGVSEDLLQPGKMREERGREGRRREGRGGRVGGREGKGGREGWGDPTLHFILHTSRLPKL